jgi:hypothetical protein
MLLLTLCWLCAVVVQEKKDVWQLHEFKITGQVGAAEFNVSVPLHGFA